MNAGKSTILLQASHNYQERGMQTLLLTAKLDTRAGPGVIASRIGLSSDAFTFREDTDLFSLIKKSDFEKKRSCVLVDEAQFLSKKQVWQLARVADQLDLPVMCYGLRTDFQGKLFQGSGELLAIADDIREIIERVSGRELNESWFPWSPVDSSGSLEGVIVTGYEYPHVFFTDSSGNQGVSDITCLLYTSPSPRDEL